MRLHALPRTCGICFQTAWNNHLPPTTASGRPSPFADLSASCLGKHLLNRVINILEIGYQSMEWGPDVCRLKQRAHGAPLKLGEASIPRDVRHQIIEWGKHTFTAHTPRSLMREATRRPSLQQKRASPFNPRMPLQIIILARPRAGWAQIRPPRPPIRI